uniref:Glutathione transferase n=1 Tax=Graphocephala atropunctata TaxID=36148 RepID=A0A1B6KGV6_9HEMI
MPEHLTQGSTEPPSSAGKMRLYGMRFCPYDQRVHLVMIAKNIPHDNVWINLKTKPDWYLKKIPSTKVPGLLIDGQALYESLIIADYLDEKFPDRPLHSNDPLKKAKDRILIENFGKVSGVFYKVVMNPTSAIADSELMVRELLEFDKELASRGTKYFAGQEPGMLDYMIWPWFERLAALELIYGEQFCLSQDKLKSLTTWTNAMKEDKAVKEYYLQPEVHAKYLSTFALLALM